MEDEQKPGCQLPDGSAEPTTKLSGEDLTADETIQKEASKVKFVVDNAKAGIHEEPAVTKDPNSDAGEAFNEQKKEVPPEKQSCEQIEEAEPIKPTKIIEASTKTSSEDITQGDGDAGSDKDESLQTMSKISGQSEMSAEECQSPSVTTESEKADHSLKTDRKIYHQAECEQRVDSKGNTSGNEKSVITTPEEWSSQSLTSDADLATGNSLSPKDKPGQQVKETNDTAADGDFSQSATTDVLRTSQMSEEKPSKEEIQKQNIKTKVKEIQDVKTIGPTTTENEPAETAGALGGGVKFLVAVALVAIVAILVQYLLQCESPPPKADLGQVDIFLKQMEKVKANFPNQRAELWSRSEIHLKRHLQTSRPAEPVSLILTSGLRAERTMRCLAQGVASAFSSARNASVLHIDGAAKADQDSDQVKLDIDRKLQGAFEGDKPVAVIHRLEELPPGSTLIFYRYCDHENAAYKKTFLIFTVLLGDEEDIPAGTRLSGVEEMVDDHLRKKFLSHGHPVSFDRMDVNKYGGLWSRISHLILPVAAEDRIEHEGC